jgi:hypothetical protein
MAMEEEGRMICGEVHNHIADALTDRPPVTGEAELGIGHNKLFSRMGGQVFAITVEAKGQFRRVYPFWSED